ncbi:MAG: hypothetical protein EOM74_02565 [Methanomicrobia archaeon]|nr:hypothetical protein [Methanomicrobia archaeon]
MRPFEKIINEIGLDYKREIRRIVFITIFLLLLSAIAIFFLKKPYLFILLPLIIITVTILFRQHYIKQKANRIYAMQKEFVKLFTYFEVFIVNGINVYKSLERIGDYCSSTVKGHIDALLSQIDEDKSVLPFVRFARKFESLIIEQAMISIYQLIDQGNSEARLNQFHLIFEKIADQHYADNFDKTKKNLDGLNIYPLVGAGLITIMITFGIISMIGGIVSGI